MDAADILIQRFKAVEMSHQTGSWTGAKHLELIPVDEMAVITNKEALAMARAVRAEDVINKAKRQKPSPPGPPRAAPN